MKRRICMIRAEMDKTKRFSTIWAKHLEDETKVLTDNFGEVIYRYYRSESAFYLFRFVVSVLMNARRKRCDAIICYGQNRLSLFLCILRAIICPKSKLLILEFAFITPLSRVRALVYRIGYGLSNLICVCSKHEIAEYHASIGIPTNKMAYFPAPIESCYFRTQVNGRAKEECEYVLSAGRGYRDFATLIEAARMIGPELQISIIGEPKSIPSSKDLPRNINVIGEVDRDRYFNCLKNCKFVVVPLEDVKRAAGQQVIYQAVACGKYVVASDIPSTREIRDDVPERVRLCKCYDAAELAKTINSVNRETTSQGEEVSADFLMAMWGIDAFGRNLKGAIEKAFSHSEPPVQP